MESIEEQSVAGFSKNELIVEKLKKRATDVVKIDIPSVREENTDDIIKNVNNKFLIHVLSPEISANEDKKRKHKDILMIAVAIFLTIQFVILFVIVGYSLQSIISCHINEKPFSDSTIKIIFSFIGVYISAVVAEMIAILKYIVTNVFDTSIAALVEAFKDK